jgi:cytochrome c oxidase accessory protein FixG
MVDVEIKSGPKGPRGLKPTLHWHRLRKRVHLACFLFFLALPFLNVIRFDIPRQRFYFAGRELWINEFAIVFFSLMFLMFLVVAMSIFWGRVYCGYLCPQMIFSEASVGVENWIRRRITKRFGRRDRLVRAIFLAVLAAASVVLAFIFIAYFVEPRDLARRLFALDIHTAGGIAGAAVTLVTFLDFALVRQRFCTTVCPYGYLQGILSDDKTLLVHYRDDNHACIECKKCVRVCPMGIDIRKSPFQIECIHCAECIDACVDVLARLNQPGLIHYTWGEKGELTANRRQPWDGKRTVVMLVLLFYASGLATALGMRHAVLVRVAPERATLYRVASGRVYNRFRYTIANRSGKPSAVVFSIHQLPAASLEMEGNPVSLKAGEVAQGTFEISAPAASRSEMVSHFNIVASTVPDQVTDTIPMTFLAPTEGK